MTLDRKITIGLSIASIFLIIALFRSCEKNVNVTRMYEAINDTLSLTKNKLGQEVSKKLIIEAESKKNFIKAKSTSEAIKALQSTVKRYKGKLRAATSLINSTSSNGSNETIISSVDTVYNNDTVYIYPIYRSKWSNEWELGNISATKDTISHVIKIRNKFTFTLGEESNNWFKRRESIFTATNLNPNTETIESHTFRIKEKEKIVGFGLFAGMGISNSSFNSVIGAGVYYRLFSIK